MSARCALARVEKDPGFFASLRMTQKYSLSMTQDESLRMTRDVSLRMTQEEDRAGNQNRARAASRSAQKCFGAVLDNAAAQHGRIHADAGGIVLRSGLQNAEVAW